MEKTVKYLILSIAMSIGGYIPVLWGADAFGFWSLLGVLVGGIAGVYLINRLDY